MKVSDETNECPVSEQNRWNNYSTQGMDVGGKDRHFSVETRRSTTLTLIKGELVTQPRVKKEKEKEKNV